MEENNSIDQAAFLEKILQVFEQSALAYQRYLKAGKTFFFAQELKLYNSRALALLTGNKYLLPGHLQEDVMSLITHYTEWSEKWEKLAGEKNHHPDDVFAFANDITFPKHAAQSLEAAYKEFNPPAERK